MNIFICGSPNIPNNDYEFIKNILINIISQEQYNLEIPNKELKIITGNENKGTDWLVEKFTKEYDLSLKTFPIEWNDMSPPVLIGKNYYGDYNKLAITKRNRKMVDYILSAKNICITFVMEKDIYNKNIIQFLKKARVKIYRVKREDSKIKIYNGEQYESN